MRTQLRKAAAFAIITLFQILPASALAASFEEPGGETYASEDGTVPLVWGSNDVGSDVDRVYEVRRWSEGGPADGTYVYEGEDTASFVSGLNEGEYTFRIRSKRAGGTYPEWGDERLVVTVDYIDMSKVWPLMGAGSVCFVVLILTVVLGHRAAKREERV